MTSRKPVLILSIFGASGIVLQIISLSLRGETFCLNQGCKVVEQLTTISPGVFNTIGLSFFLIVATLAFFSKGRDSVEWVLKCVLLAGLSADAVFVGYQVFVAKVLCSYCLTVFGIILLLNLVTGPRQFSLGLLVILAELTAFSLLRFDLGVPLSEISLDHGTYAIRACSNPSRSLYLIFSKDCPHCKKVINTLRGCSQCEFHFNPVEKIDKMILPGLLPESSYDPKVNILTLKLLGINSIPVLIDKNDKGMLFIRGDRNIISYIEKYCFAPYPTIEEGLRQGFETKDGVCSLDEECGGLQ